MRLGVHVRIAKGLPSAVEAAERLGCEALQIFSSNPNSWRVGEINVGAAEAFREGTSRLGIRTVALHTPYLLNLASSNDRIWDLSARLLVAALKRADAVGGEYVVTHIGSHGGAGFDVGADRVRDAVTRAIDDSESGATVLLEAGSGAGNTVGSTFEELAEILARLDDRPERVGVCLDTAHLWGAGYDLSTADAVSSVLADFDRIVGLPRLRLFHLNDTQKELGSHADRHWHIGRGQIGIEGFRAIVNHPALQGIAGIIETPEMESGMDVENLNVLKKLRVTSGD